MEPIRFREGSVLALGATTARVAIPQGARWVHITATVPGHIAFGDVTIEATASNFAVPGGYSEVLEVPAGTTHVAGLKVSGGSDGFLGVAASG